MSENLNCPHTLDLNDRKKSLLNCISNKFNFSNTGLSAKQIIYSIIKNTKPQKGQGDGYEI